MAMERFVPGAVPVHGSLSPPAMKAADRRNAGCTSSDPTDQQPIDAT